MKVKELKENAIIINIGGSNLVSKYNNTNNIIYRPLTNNGIEEDSEDPKEAAHLDYKYLRTYTGPLSLT